MGIDRTVKAITVYIGRPIATYRVTSMYHASHKYPPASCSFIHSSIVCSSASSRIPRVEDDFQFKIKGT